MRKGKLISFEGIDGAGKGTQIALLKEWYQANTLQVIDFREPGSNPGADDLAEKTRANILESQERIDDITELLGFSTARSQLYHGPIPQAINTGVNVILDRSFDSTYAYQGFGGAKGDPDFLKQFEEITQIATGGRAPDLTIYLRITREVSKQRISQRKLDYMESKGEEYFDRVFEGFETRAQQHPERIKVIDANRDIQTIHNDIVFLVEQLCK